MFRKLRLFLCLLLATSYSGYAQPPVVTISATPSTIGCPPLAISFNANVAGTGPFMYAWNFGGVPPNVSKSTSILKNDVVIFNTAGTYNVTLIVTNGSGSTTATPVQVTVNPIPVADFTQDKTTGCFPTTVHFTNTSPAPGSITKFIWDFGDGTQDSTNFNTSHLYKNAGSFPVVLYVKNAFGCTGSAAIKNVNQAITLANGVIPNFSNTLNSSCMLPVTANFINSSTGPGTLDYLWDFGDGTAPLASPPAPASPIHNYAAAGSYIVKLAVTSNQGCSDTLKKTVNISSNGSVTDFSVIDTVCLNTPVVFTNTSSPMPNSSTWNYGDGTGNFTQPNGLHTFTTAGMKTVTLSNVFAGCTGTASKNIFVVTAPVTAFTGTNLTSCTFPLTSSFTDNTPGANTWLWNFGDGTTSTIKNPPAHTYNAYGTFVVTLTASTAPGCSSSTTNSVSIQKPTLILNGLPAYGCAPFTFSTSASASTVDGVAFYSWNFIGNGNTSNVQAPPPQTYGPGSSYVICTITTNGGCQVSDTGIVKVGTVKPTADFNFVPSTACVKSPVQFTDASSIGTNQWYWSFGDGGSDTVKNPLYKYLQPGTFKIKLIAYNNGCFDSITKTIVINPPLADFKFASLCGAGNTFTFTDNSTMPMTWAWDFGDFTISNIQNPPAHVFPVGPTHTYNVSLTVTNGGCSDKVTYPVTANQSTQISFTANPVCANTSIFLTALAPTTMANYTFIYGDGNTSSGSSASVAYTYKKPGNYSVKVITTDLFGCVDSSAVYPMVVNGPAVNFTVPTNLSCGPISIPFNNLTVPNGSPIKTYSWDFGDGSISALPSPTHLYNFQGVFQPRLTVVDNNGCSASLDTLKPITVSVMVPHFLTSDSNYCPASFIQFNNTSTGGFMPTYYWNFGDGSPIDSANISPIHNYPFVGQYTDTLTMKDTVGCIKKFWNTPKINIDTPNASFTISANYSACPPLNVKFTFTGHYPQTYSWNFGNVPPSFSNQPAPTFLYSQPGDYYPTLKVTSPGGCQVTSAPEHIHIDGPIGVFTYSPLAGCDNLTVNFNVATSNVVNFTYVYGDNTSSGQVASPTISHLYTTPGAFYPFVILEDASGCKVVQIGINPINVDHITQTLFKTDKIVVCDSGTVIFKDASILGDSTQITNYQWNFNDGTPVVNGLFPSIPHFYNMVGVYNATLTITTLGLCTGVYSMPISVVAAPKIAINGLINQCEPATLTFSGNELVPDPYGPLTWTWNFGNGTTGTGPNPPNVSYPKAGEYVVQLTATNTKGCSTLADTTQPNHLFIYPIPTVNAGADATICDTSTLQLNATGNANSYTWLPPANGNLTCLNCANPIASSPISTYFIVQGTTLFGCKANDTINVTVNTQLTINATGTDSVCLGQSTQLNVTGGAIYSWSPALGLDNPNIANPVVTPVASQIGSQPSNVIVYTVTGYDNKKCYSDSKSVDITAFNYPVITLVPNATINVGSSYQINSTVTTNIVSLNWVPSNTLSCSNCLSPLATPTKTTKYNLTAINEGGCPRTDSIRIQVICNGANFFVPNTFSPNGDGVNDHFVVNGVGLNVIPSITIYNRWGQIVFQKSNFAANSTADAWDGTFNGQPAPPDVYIYTIQILCNNATLIPYHGNVTLIR